MRSFLIVIAAALLLAAGASAQIPGKPFTLYGQAGLSLPQQDLNDGWKTGYHASVGLGMPIMPKLEGVARVAVHRFASDMSGLDGGEMTSMMLGADLKLNAGMPMMTYKPYLFAGAGFARMEVADMTAVIGAATGLAGGVSSETNTKLYYTIGGGLEFGMLFIEARYVSAKVDDAKMSYLPISLGIKF